MKAINGWVFVVIALVILIGCGGGGGGGGTTNTDGGSTGLNTGVTGRIRDTAGQPVVGATVRFYNNSGALVGQTTTNSNGNFSAELPANTRRFTVDASTSPTAANYFNQFNYNSAEYLANDTSCLATGPSYSQGQVVNLASEIVLMLRWMGPPPPPTGCLGD